MMFFYQIPTQIETVTFGAIRPKTMPQILSVLIGVFGAVLMIKPADGSDLRQVPWGRTGLIVAILVAGLWLIAQVGFVTVSPALALVLMLVMGERRAFWLCIGAAAMPALIWFCVTILLQRPLP